MRPSDVNKAVWSLILAGWFVVAAEPAIAHCDTMDGPVTAAATRALKTGDVNLVLVWVQPGDEAEIRREFERTREEREVGDVLPAAADQRFFETLVRVHRAGEGAPYIGIKPAGTPIDPGVREADRSLESGSVDEVEHLLISAVQAQLREYFKAVMDLRDYPSDDVAAGRAYVRAYVTYTHFVESIHQALGASDHKHSLAPGDGHDSEQR